MLEVRSYGIEISRLVKMFSLRNGGPAPTASPADPASSVTALDGVDLRVNPNELFVILGPSGCGKSTLLRCVAGLEEGEQGEIRLGDRTVYSTWTGEAVAARDRQVGMVFQNFALYPHMSVAENVAFGLRTRKVPRPEITQRVAEALRLVEMEEFADRSPARLSGGQQQRVAIARAVAGRPRVLLFDEPLSNLDPILRKSLRAELRMLIRRLGVTTLFVTHDQEEAMILGDRLAVMNRGRVEQIGTPGEVYSRPQTLFVARFTGRPVTNLLEGVVDVYEGVHVLVPIESRAEMLRIPASLERFRNQRVTLHVRPEDVEVASGADEGVSSLRVLTVLPEGSHSYVHFHLGGPYDPLVARTGPADVAKESIGGQTAVRLARGTVYNPDSGYLIGEF